VERRRDKLVRLPTDLDLSFGEFAVRRGNRTAGFCDFEVHHSSSSASVESLNPAVEPLMTRR